MLPSIEAFKKAIANSDNEMLTSMPDWAPTASYPRHHRRHRSRRASDESFGVSFSILRWPILLVLTLWIVILLLVYALVRFWVSISEWLWVWRGRRKALRSRLRKSTSYRQWQETAAELDRYLGFDAWREDPKSSLYDYRAVSRLVKQLRRMTEIDTIEQAERLAVALEFALKFNFAGIHHQAMYSQTYSGTKLLVDELNELLVSRVDMISDSLLPLETKKLLFESFSKQFGRSALSLSGGASFAYRHFGVVKALLDQDLLPDIVAGTSGGGLVAALVGTRTNEELRSLLNPVLADHLTACWEPFPQWLLRFWHTGARFDSVDWAERSRFFTYGDLTFKEAYKRTGRVLNITMVPADAASPSVLCNYMTTPNCVIWSALLASAAVPGILNPVVLMEKNQQGEFGPYSVGSRWRDGSLRTDVPIQALNTFFNVNFPIVSQVNPHIRLFAYLPKGQVGRPVIHKYSNSRWRGGFLLSALEISVKLEVNKCVKLIKNLNLIPHYLSQDWSSIFLQKFTGAVTVWPKAKPIDYWRILQDPNREQLKDLIQGGELAMFPKISMINHFVALERAVQDGLKRFSGAPKSPRETMSVESGSAPETSPYDDPGMFESEASYEPSYDASVNGVTSKGPQKDVQDASIATVAVTNEQIDAQNGPSVEKDIIDLEPEELPDTEKVTEDAS